MSNTFAGRLSLLLPLLLCAAGSLHAMEGKAIDGKAGTMGGHVHESCAGTPLECARKASPAFAPDGSLWLALSSTDRVHVLRSTDLGSSFARPVEITKEASRLDQGADARPALAIDRQNRITVGYAVMTDRPFTGELLYAHSGDRGASFGSPRPLSVDPAGKRFPSFATGPDGELVAAWIDKRGLEAADEGAYAGAALAMAWSTDGGASFGETGLIQDHTCECCRVGLQFAAAGRPVVLWRNLFGAARDHAVLTFAGPGTPGPVRRVSDDDWQIDACPHHGPSLAVAKDGSYHVAWFTASKRRHGLFYAHSTDAGATFSEPMPIGTPDRQPARPQVLAARDGIWLAWQEFDGRTTTVSARHSADGGRTWSGSQVIAESTGMTDLPILIAAPDGRPYLSWLTRPEGYRLIAMPEL